MGQCCSRKSMDGLNMEDRTNYLGNAHVINTREEWESKLSEATDEKIAIVVFTASWCGPCKTIEPYFAELSDKYPQMMFLVVDVDEMPELSGEWDIRAMPTFVFIRNGKEIEKLVGSNKPELEKLVVKYAASAE